MKNIIRELGYHMRKDGLLLRVNLLVTVLLIAVMFVSYLTQDDASGFSRLIAASPQILLVLHFGFMGINIGWFAGGDMKDKVINYEILQGHSRLRIFLARTLPAIFLASFIFLFQELLALVIPSAVFGWGDVISYHGVILRILLTLLPALRMAAFLALLTFVVKNSYVIMACSVVLPVLIGILMEGFSEACTYAAGYYNALKLFSYTDWGIYNVDPVKGIVEYMSYTDSLSPSLVIGTVLVSVIMTLLYLLAGYALFRREDLN